MMPFMFGLSIGTICGVFIAVAISYFTEPWSSDDFEDDEEVLLHDDRY